MTELAAMTATGLTAADVVGVLVEIINGVVVPVLSGMILRTIYIEEIELRFSFFECQFQPEISASDSSMGLGCFFCDCCYRCFDFFDLQRSQICH